ncbi:hypothetical protein P154DRAFT_565879 [Amniculicola lignicola CBS 123094]|uniref:Cora-domain-containing protein n=1 Tax=Amniculicola lignicola CBS 123094 TaxID=1392246 RepID=A0A6A5WC27_9PLEO|nr:hypothetical protein P154DRAFT_565879 [Amniculicola lignicola CBS 123094]
MAAETFEMRGANNETTSSAHTNGSNNLATPVLSQKQPETSATVSSAKSITPSTVKTDKIGLWLCDEGPYQEYIAKFAGSNPGLKSPDPANKDWPLKTGNATVCLLEASASTTGPVEFTKTQFASLPKLRKHFEETDHKHDKHRVYIMEGLATDYIAVIGGHFFMEPTFFQRQERTCVWSNEFTPTSDALPHPSLLDPEKAFHLQYCELRQFDADMSGQFYFCQRTGRHVGMTKARTSEKEKSTTAILRRKTSFWSRKTSGKGWDAVILVDPQLDALAKWPQGKPLPKNHAFQDGYNDFLPSVSKERVLSKDPHPHTSMLRDLSHYFENHSDLIPARKWAAPATASFFLKKIVAAHYLQLVDYIKVMLPSLELRLTTAWVEEQDQWKSLQTISRRCGNYRDDIEDTLLSLGYPVQDLPYPETGPDVWLDDKVDFQYIYFRLKTLKQRTDTLIQAMTGLASIAGNRQNLEEAKVVKRLTLVALLFIPLSFTSSLFSMQDGFAPGAAKFWIYWVTAIAAIALTFSATWVLNYALDDAAQWTSQPLDWLKFWDKNKRMSIRKQRRSHNGQNVRRTTGLW